jgi:hypothetical protein
MRQALWFGNVTALAAFVALLWPLAASFFVSNVALTIWLYGLAMLIDVALLCAWLVLALRYSRRAGRGELFDAPWLVRLTGASSHKR